MIRPFLTPHSRLWCVVPAAGVGKRFGAGQPKQYLTLHDQTIMEWTLQRLLRIPRIEKIVVAISEEDTQFAQLSIAQQDRIHTVSGGRERCDSVQNGLQWLLKQTAGDNDDWVLVHDVARPCVRLEDITRLIDEVAQSGAIGGILANPVRDTMKRSDAQGRIMQTVERAHLWHALTPQLFPLKTLLQALQQADQMPLDSNREAVTDEASAMERQGHCPILVPGHSDNIKITHPQDLQLARLFLQQQMLESEQEAT